jgi:hypothetical protein
MDTNQYQTHDTRRAALPVEAFNFVSEVQDLELRAEVGRHQRTEEP